MAKELAPAIVALPTGGERLTLVEKGVANVHGDLALLQMRLDRQGERIERIEKRLDLTAA